MYGDDFDPSAQVQELASAAMLQVQQLAPVVAESSPGSKQQKGIDVVLRSDFHAQQVEERVKRWLVARNLDDRMQAWTWSGGSSTGQALTEAGREVGRELRLSRRRTR